MKKKCLECSDEFTGRSDKKFCSDYCRNAYNNKLRGESSNYIRNINNVLRRNRKIMEDLAPNGKGKATKEKLLQLGYNFEYFTNQLSTKTGNNYTFCYDFGFMEIEKDYYAIVKKLD